MLVIVALSPKALALLLAISRPVVASYTVVLFSLIFMQGENNIQDRLAYLEDQAEIQDDPQVSFRLLRHYASSVQHCKYQGIDIVTVQVQAVHT